MDYQYTPTRIFPVIGSIPDFLHHRTFMRMIFPVLSSKKVHNRAGYFLFFSKTGPKTPWHLKYRLLKELGICVLFLLLVSCSVDTRSHSKHLASAVAYRNSSNEDLVHYIREVNHRKTQEIEPIPLFSTVSDFTFPENVDKRSPFKPMVQKRKTDINEQNKSRYKQSLEAFSLDLLKFVGILKQENEVWALIESPDKNITPVRVGDYLGQNDGRIELIKHEVIQLIEITKNSGRLEKHKTTIKLFTGK